MEMQELLDTLIEEGTDKNKVISELCSQNPDIKKGISDLIDQYENRHKILEREDKIIKTKDGPKKEAVAKLILSYQRKIVNYAVAFLFGKPVTLSCSNKESEKAFDKFKEHWKSLKMDSVLREFSRKIFVEKEAALLIYPQIKEEGTEKIRKLRCMILCESNKDSIYPYFDNYGDLIAFTRKFKVKNSDGKEVEKLTIYTADAIFDGEKSDNWIFSKKENIIKKIPVIYAFQNECEWNDVQSLIDRQEMLISKNADANDYFGNPALVSKGKLKNAPSKGEVGRFFQIEGEKNGSGDITYGDVEILTWDRAPESIKMEHSINDNFIHGFTNTPNITIDTIKGLGNLSGIALKLLFYDAILKSQNKQEIFGEVLERLINLLKVMIGGLIEKTEEEGFKKLNVEFEFGDNVPLNTQEMIDMLSVAAGGKPIISQVGAVSKNPLVQDSVAEMENIGKEKEESINSINSKLNESFS